MATGPKKQRLSDGAQPSKLQETATFSITLKEIADEGEQQLAKIDSPLLQLLRKGLDPIDPNFPKAPMLVGAGFVSTTLGCNRELVVLTKDGRRMRLPFMLWRSMAKPGNGKTFMNECFGKDALMAAGNSWRFSQNENIRELYKVCAHQTVAGDLSFIYADMAPALAPRKVKENPGMTRMPMSCDETVAMDNRISKGEAVNEHKFWVNAWDSRNLDHNNVVSEASVPR